MKNLWSKITRKPAEPEDFYIGYHSYAPPEFKKFIRLIIFAVVVVIYITVSILVSNQQNFSTGKFDRNKLTELEGMLMLNPFPALRTFYGKDLNGNPTVKTIPLVNYGKFGAASIIEAVGEKNNARLDQLWVKLRGKLIYNKGVTLLELSEKENAILSVTPADKKQLAGMSSVISLPMDTVTLSGQVIDPKCYFGVMNPGEGKPHSDCAIRCIAGGIQPLLMIRSNKGEETFFILRDTLGEPLNDRILTFIGMPVQVSGRLTRVDDWLILNTNPASGIRMTKR